MRRVLPFLLLPVLLAGCNSKASSGEQATATVRSVAAAPTPRPTAHGPSATPTVVVNRTYLSFVHSTCRALAARDSKAITDLLMYYQYNSGLRWGRLGDGEGQTTDPSLMSVWLARARPRCMSYTAGIGGHGTILSTGWSQPGPAAIIEMDIVNGTWKINDFTFGSRGDLARAMHLGQPVISFSG